jgi:hypothetical protein
VVEFDATFVMHERTTGNLEAGDRTQNSIGHFPEDGTGWDTCDVEALMQ